MWIQLSINGTKKGDGVNGKENMIKIDWKLLPDWVNYVVMDDDGSWYAYEKKPVTKLNYGEWNEITKMEEFSLLVISLIGKTH